MPVLAWRTDVDGFIFENHWTFDSAERVVLAGNAAVAVPFAVAQLVALFPPLLGDPLLPIWTATASAAAAGIASSTTQAYGLCGGMAYSSLDYWYAKAPLPCGSWIDDQPARTTPTGASLRALIWNRLIDSLTTGGCLQQTIAWSLVLNQLPSGLGGAGTLLEWTKKEWLKIKASIDAGNPCPIGLIYKNTDIWNQHQILVYGYDSISNGARLYVYDSNYPHGFGETDIVPKKDFLTFDLSGASLSATSPSDEGTTLAGFFCTDYSRSPPPSGLDTSYGKFITWDGVKNVMTAYGALLPIADATELTALGGTLSDLCIAHPPPPSKMPHPRDNALLREHSSAPVFLYQGGAPFWIPDPKQLMNFGGWSAVRVVPDATLGQFAGAPVNGTLLREFSDSQVFVWNTGAFLPSPTPSTSADVRLVPDGAIQSRLLNALTLDYSAITSGGSCNGTVSLKTAFPGADISVTLASSQPAVVTVPPSVTIPKGATISAPFKVTSTGAAPPAGTYSVQITGALGEFSVANSILIEPPDIAQFTLAPQTVTAGQSSTATLTLQSAYSADLHVDLFSFSTFADVQSPIIIPKGSKSVTFQVTTPARNYPFPSQSVDIQASYANISATAVLTVESSVVAGIVKSITLNPSLVPNGSRTTATITLDSAVSVDTDVNLDSHPPPPATALTGASGLIASMPSKITIPAGSTQGTFIIQTNLTSPQVKKRTAVIEAIAVKFVQANLTLAT